jgi:hypothetical protein
VAERLVDHRARQPGVDRAAALETVAALVLGLAGATELRRRGLAAAAVDDGDELAPAAVLGHPLVLAMLLGNLVLFAGTIATR